MARYLITGIAGFIGSSLAHALVDQGHEVRGIDNLSTGNLDNLADIRDRISFQEMDLQDVSGIKSACEGIDYVLHQGALASVPRSVKDPITSHESNVNGTLNLLMAAHDLRYVVPSNRRIPGIFALRRKRNVKHSILRRHSRALHLQAKLVPLFQNRNHQLFGRPGIGRALQHHELALLQPRSGGLRRIRHITQVRLAMLRQRSRHAHNYRVLPG